MLTAGLAQRYAKALLSAVAQGEAVEQTAAELEMVMQVCAANRALRACLDSPALPAPLKQRVIHELLAGKIGTLTLDFLGLLLKKQRFGLLAAIRAAFEELIEEMRGIARVNVVSALPLRSGEQDYLQQRLEKWLKQSVHLTVAIKPELLCGIQIRLGDRLFDGSGFGRLEQMRAALSAF